MGIPGCIFLSYGYSENIVLTLGELSLPFYIAVIPYNFFITFLSIVLCYSYIQSQKREKYIKSLEILNDQLNEINHSVSQKIFSLENDSTNEERKRISKEIHDTAGYVFVNLIMMLQAASAVFNKDSKKAESLINDARDYAERGINEIRYILHEIRNYAPKRISLQNEMYSIGKAFNRATEVEVNINYGNWPQTFLKNVDSFFLLFIQESLTNALKHGHASSISISCWKNEHSHTITISDNGMGTTLPIKKGIGITALEDMVNRYNGYILIRSDETGFSIQVLIPNDEL
jgi:signal transduction histidine kinase